MVAAVENESKAKRSAYNDVSYPNSNGPISISNSNLSALAGKAIYGTKNK